MIFKDDLEIFQHPFTIAFDAKKKVKCVGIIFFCTTFKGISVRWVEYLMLEELTSVFFTFKKDYFLQKGRKKNGSKEEKWSVRYHCH